MNNKIIYDLLKSISINCMMAAGKPTIAQSGNRSLNEIELESISDVLEECLSNIALIKLEIEKINDIK